MARNPAVILYDADSKPLAVQDGMVIPVDTPGLLLTGRDDSGNARVMGVDSGRRAAIQNQPNMDVALSTRASLAVQTDGTQKAIIRGGAKGTTPAADITSSHIDNNRQAIDTRIFGSGTNGSQQVEGLAADGAATLGNPVWIGGHDGTNVRALQSVLDGTLYRLQAEAKVAIDKNGTLHHLRVLENGSLVTTGTAVPVSDPTKIRNEYVVNGGSSDLRVNGSGTPVVFTYAADSTVDTRIISINFMLVASSIKFDGDSFGPISALTNGVEVKITAESQTAIIHEFFITEHIREFASSGGFDYFVAANDAVGSLLDVGGSLTLVAGSADKIEVTIRDKLTSKKIKYFACFVKGIKEVS